MIVNYVIDIDNTKEQSVDDMDECLICLEILNDNSNNPIYILECCNNSVHLRCLYKWYMVNNKKTCFLCNQSNPFCNDISNQRFAEVYNELSSERSSDSLSDGLRNNLSNSDSHLIIQPDLSNTLHARFIILIFTGMSLFLIIVSITILSQHIT